VSKASIPEQRAGSQGYMITHVRGLPALLFPFLPIPAAVGCTLLAAATVAARGIAWYGNVAHSTGVALGVFVAVALTGFTLAAAGLPRVTYAWLDRDHWFADGEGVTPAFGLSGGHLPLAGNVGSRRCGMRSPTGAWVGSVRITAVPSSPSARLGYAAGPEASWFSFRSRTDLYGFPPLKSFGGQRDRAIDEIGRQH
jgi:hypothetical protein